MSESDTEKVRIDKWLWAVRLFKTRSLAATACQGGCITVRGRRVKPSRSVAAGEEICLREPGLTRTVRVLAVTEKRVGAPRVAEYLEDRTPAEEYARRKEEASRMKPFVRGRGMGRPTKRERRILDALREME